MYREIEVNRKYKLFAQLIYIGLLCTVRSNIFDALRKEGNIGYWTQWKLWKKRLIELHLIIRLSNEFT